MLNLNVNAHVSKSNKIIAVPKLPALANLFPDAKLLPHPQGDLLLLPHGLAEFAILKRLGVQRLEHPMLSYYGWTGMKPFDAQRSTCAMLTTNHQAYVLNSMGTGKTNAALWAWDYLYGNNLCGKLLVLGKLSTLTRVWLKEFFATLPHRRAVVVHGSKKKRLLALNDTEADAYILNHDGVKVMEHELFSRTDINVLVIDELAEFRNLNARSKLVAKLARTMQWVWGMTGSPMPHEPTDVWMQCRIVRPHVVPEYFTHAKTALMVRGFGGVHDWQPRDDAKERAYAYMQPAVRFSLDDVTELPDVNEQWIDVPLGPKQKIVYKTIARDYQIQIGNNEITALNAAGAMNKLLQISGGFVYTADKKTIVLDADERLQAMVDIITSASHKVLVFAPFRHMVHGIADRLVMEDIDHAIIHGGVSKRDDIFAAFQDTGRYKVIVAHPGCMAHGLTLTSANVIIWYCPLPNFDIYEQANARIRRVGQRNKQLVFHLQGTPVEKKIYRLLKDKEMHQTALLDLFAYATATQT